MPYTNYSVVGPKPEPVPEPTHPTPWRTKGRRILDANGKVVFIVKQTSDTAEGLPHDIGMTLSYELARVVAEAINAQYRTVESSKSPF